MKKTIQIIQIFALALLFFKSSAQPQIQIAVQFAGVDTNQIRFLESTGTEIVIGGISINAGTLNTIPPLMTSTNPGADVFIGIVNNLLQSAPCLETDLGITELLSSFGLVEAPLQKAVYSGNFSGSFGTSLPLICNQPVCGFLFARNKQCQVTNTIKFESNMEFRIFDLATSPSSDDIYFGGAFTGQTTIGGNSYNAGFDQWGILVKYNLTSGISDWQTTLESIGFLSYDKITYDQQLDRIYALAKIGNTATYNDGSSQTVISAPSPGNAYALLEIAASSGALLDFTTIASSSLILASGIIKSTSGIYVALNSFFSTIFPDATNPFFSIPGNGGVDIDVLRYDLTLTYQGNRKIGTAKEDFSTRFRELKPNRFVLLGYEFKDTRVNSSQTESLPITAQATMFFLDNNLNLLDSIITGGKGFDTFFDADIDSLGNLYACGMFSDTTDLDPDTTSVYQMISTGSFDGFIAKYDISYLVGTGKYNAEENFAKVFPNPASDKLHINIHSKKTGHILIQMLNSHGKEIYEVAFTDSRNLKHSFNCSGLSPGIYFLKVIVNDKSTVRKIIKI